MDLTTIEHVKLQVDDISEASDFCRDVLGLGEVSETDGTRYFGCGRVGSFDVAIAEGRPGLEHVALRADDPDAIETQTRRLTDAGVETVVVDGEEPGQERGVRFCLPGGTPVEVVTTASDGYAHDDDPALPARSDRAPVALDHVNITTPAVRDDTDLLTEVVGLQLSEVVGSRDDWELAFTRCGESHHDIAVGSVGSQPPGLHHIAWEYRGLEHMKQLIDRLAASDIPLERGLGRHYAGNNLYSYVRPPGGNRMEILAEMARVHTTEVSYVQEYESASVAWGADPPDTFNRVSGIVGDVEPGN